MNNNFNLNKVTLLGRLGKDPEQRSEKAPVEISVSTRISWKDKESGEWKEKTTWHDRIQVWGRSGEYAINNLHQGDMVYVEGELAKESYEAKDGGKRVNYYVKATDIKLVERNTNSDDEQGGSAAPAKKSGNRPPASKPNKQNENSSAPLEDDDVPF